MATLAIVVIALMFLVIVAEGWVIISIGSKQEKGCSYAEDMDGNVIEHPHGWTQGCDNPKCTNEVVFADDVLYIGVCAQRAYMGHNRVSTWVCGTGCIRAGLEQAELRLDMEGEY